MEGLMNEWMNEWMKSTNRAEGTPRLKLPLLTFFPLKKVSESS